jgi:hypothetical protein
MPAFKDRYAMAIFSRFYAYRWAPKNIFSYFCGILRGQLRQCDLLFTFINPNIGFIGNSHTAASFQFFAYEEGTEYMYEGEAYRTMRYVLDHPEVRFQPNAMPLHPMQILAMPLNHRAAKAIPAEPYVFMRPNLAVLAQ